MIKLLILLSLVAICLYVFFGNQISNKTKKYLIIFFIGAIALILIFSGKLNFLPVALAPALLFFRRISSLLSILNFFSRSSFGSKFKPTINTKYLKIQIMIQSKQAIIEIIEGEFKGKVVLIVDDSIVRGNTSKRIVQMARDSGAKKVYFASCSPPIIHPNVYGIDMPAKKEYVAYGRNNDEICMAIGADILFYQKLVPLPSHTNS